MEFIMLGKEEFLDVMQHINLVKTKFSSDDTWLVCPVLYAAEESIDIILDSEKKSREIVPGEKVILKFQKFSCEYLVGGEVLEISSNYYTTVTIKYTTVQKYSNMRKHQRFEIEMKVDMVFNDGHHVKSLMKNISRGGAMIVSDEDMLLDSLVSLQTTFLSGNSFTAVAKIVRKASCADNRFSYGVRFLEIPEGSSKIINKVISKYEREYLKSLHMLRKYNKKYEMGFDARIAIFSYDPDESYEIKEYLVKLGAENFEVFQGFKFHADFFVEERPKIIIIDATDASEDIISIVRDIGRDFPQIHIILLVPMEYASKNDRAEAACENAGVLYKPLICNEFEEAIIRYL